LEVNRLNNLVALRIEATSDKKFSELMLEIKDTVSGAIKNQNYPLDKLLKLTNYIANDTKAPLMNTIVLLNDIHNRESARDAHSDMLFSFSLSNENILLDLEYNSDLFEDEKVYSIIEQLVRYFEQVTINPDLKLWEVDILSQEEKNKLLNEFNDTKCKFPEGMTIQQLIEEQAYKSPDKIALVCNDSKLTYKEFNEKANQLARLLRKKGVEANSIVGIMAERSIYLMVGLLGILKAGGAYMPIDPSYPKNRINYMLKDSGGKIILTQKELVDSIEGNSEIILIDDESIYTMDKSNIEKINTGKDLAYVLYTSGTTGKPKGVMIEQDAAMNLIYSVTDRIEINSDNTILCLTTFCFDIFVFETWVAFSKGLKVVLTEENDQYNLKKLSEIIVNNKVDILQLTPSRMKMFLRDRHTIDCLESIKVIGLAGENFKGKLLKEVKRHTKARIYNLYGPTEATVYAAIKDLTEEDDITIGGVVANTQFYIVDKYNKLQPLGVPGELCIAGKGLARGYLNRMDLTEEKFIQNPFEVRKKMYRTGDLARWLPNGDIEYIQRIDFQVKIRGFRIEVGEIEDRLINHPSINEAVIIDLTNFDNNKYLCAYVVCSGKVSTMELREYLRKDLPEYMIPSYFIMLDKLPINKNGKLERKLLPIPDSNVASEVEYVPPRNNVEEKLVELWKQVLRVEKIGINDNFFALGGDSLKAIEIISKLIIDFDVKTNDIFRYQTIAALAEKLSYKAENLKSTIEQVKQLAKNTDKLDPEISNLRNYQLEDYYRRNEKYLNVDLSKKVEYNNIFLTGVTGYLGVHLLFQLLINTNANIYLPIRSKENIDAEERLLQKVSFFFGSEFYENYKNRIYILECDVVKEKFALPDDVYKELSDKIDCIINSAANVKHHGREVEFYDINVDLVNGLVKFASTGKRKDINHISSLGVGKGDVEDYKKVLFTEYEIDPKVTLDSNYIKTKSEAEKLIISAREKGINTNIFRCGNLSFNYTTHKFQENISDNAVLTFIKSLIEIGIMPEINRKLFEISPIDYASKAIILLFDKVNLLNEIYHLCNPNEMSMKEIGQFIKMGGYDIKFISIDEFMDFLYENYESSEYKEHITKILIDIYLLKIYHNRNIEIASSKTVSILKRLNLEWPRVNEEYIEELLRYCRSVKFIKKEMVKEKQ
jgi:amino acid adenylation domain-containing protein/thioester reductase-like protein